MSNDRAIEAMREDMNRLRGRLFGAIETMGVPEKQEVAAKRLIRQLTYDVQADLEAALKES
jgi:hypothetical protein